MALLSVIVPVYNVEDYIERCVKSIMNQKLNDIEILLVDDGSSDQSGLLCDQLAKQDDRIIVIHQANKGVSAARNTGLDRASGKYIGFVDSDCWIDASMYLKMCDFASENNAQIVCCNWSENGNNYMSPINKSEIVCMETFYYRLFDMPRSYSDCIWNKVYLRGFIGNARFNENVRQAEDYLFLAELYTKRGKAGYLSDTLYFGEFRPGSATNSGTFKRYQALEVRENYLNVWRARDRKLYQLAVKECLDLSLRFKGFMIIENESKEHLEKVDNLMRKVVHTHWKAVIFNKTMFWKTKMMYMLKYMI